MFLENIEIKNFKSIRHQKIEGCKRINLFIGYPNVGKSNILEALSFLSLISEPRTKIEDICRVGEFSELFFDGNVVNRIEVSYVNSRKLDISYYNSRELSITNQVSFSDKFVNEPSQYNKKDELEERSIKISKKGFNEIIQNQNFRFYFSESDLDSFEVKRYEFFKNVERNRDVYDSLLFPDGQNLFYIIERNGSLRNELVELLAEYGLKLFFDRGDNYSMKAMKTLSDDTVFTIPFYQIADTLQRLIFYKAAIQTNEKTNLIFEEPESHMFPPYIKRFASDVVLDKNENQFFIATHSPYVLDAVLEEAKPDEVSIYLVDYKNGETIIKSLKDNDIEEIRSFGVDLFFNIENYLNGDK